MAVLDLGGKHVVVDGMIIERDLLHIAEKLIEIDPNIVILANNPDNIHHNIGEEPWLICETCTDGRIRKIFGVWELNESVVDRVRMADTFGRDVLGDIDRNNRKVKENKEKKFKENIREANEIAHKILQTRQSRYTFKHPQTGDVIAVYDDKPAEKVS